MQQERKTEVVDRQEKNEGNDLSRNVAALGKEVPIMPSVELFG